MAGWGYQIYPNESARNRQFFGSRGRGASVQLLVLHTGEIAFDAEGEDTTAERLSEFMGSATSQVSWHASVDSDSVVHELPGAWSGANVRGWNSRIIGIEQGAFHTDWPKMSDEHRNEMIANLALVSAWFCQNHDLPVRLVPSLDAANQGMRGIAAHSTLDPSRRKDPGPDFPWDDYIAKTKQIQRSTGRIVGLGDEGPEVGEAQRALTSAGYGALVGVVDDDAGPKFDDAVRAYESDRGLAETGLWAPRRALGTTTPPAGSSPMTPIIDRQPAASPEPMNGSTEIQRGQNATPSSGRIELSASVGARGTNRPEDVALIRRRLEELGFLRPNRSLAHSIRLFQAAKSAGQRLAGFDGRVDPGQDTLAWLNAKNAPRWVRMPAGSDEEGFRSRERLQQSDDHGWGTSWLAETLQAAGRQYRQVVLDDDPSAPLIWSNDASPKLGGDTPSHAGHEAGMQLDLVLPPGAATALGLTVTSDRYDRRATREILLAFRAQNNIKVIYLNDSALIVEGLCKRADGHDNHIQIHIKAPKRIDLDPDSAGVVTPRPNPVEQPGSEGQTGGIDWVFIKGREGFQTTGYVPPGDRSGVTIGTGFDLGQHDVDYLRRLDVDDQLLGVLTSYMGKKGASARSFLAGNPLKITEAQARVLDQKVQADKTAGLRALYNNDSTVAFDSIPPAAQTVVASVLFQYGRPRRVPKFWAHATKQDWPKVIAELRDFGDNFGTRRRAEADYLERGLASERAVSAEALLARASMDPAEIDLTFTPMAAPFDESQLQ